MTSLTSLVWRHHYLIGGARFDDGAGSDNEVQRSMLELITQLDGFDPRGNIKILIATNRFVLSLITHPYPSTPTHPHPHPNPPPTDLIPSYPGSHTLVPRFSYPRTPDLIPTYPGSHTLVPRISYPRTPDLIPSYPGSHTLVPRFVSKY